MGYEVKNGKVITQDGIEDLGPISNDEIKARLTPDVQRVPPFELSQKFAEVIPQGCALDDIMHALNMLMAEAVARRGTTLEQRKQIADAFHVGLLRSLEMNGLVEQRVKDIKAKLSAEGKTPSEAEFRELITAEMKKAADEIRAQLLVRTASATEKGLQ